MENLSGRGLNCQVSIINLLNYTGIMIGVAGTLLIKLFFLLLINNAQI